MNEKPPLEKTVALAEPPLSDDVALHVLKQDDLFAVFNARGDFQGLMHPIGPSTGADGLFQDDTRILSRLSLMIAGQAPRLLSSTVSPDNVVFTAELTNPPLIDRDRRAVPHDHLHISRRRFLWRRKLYETLLVRSYLPTPLALDVTYDVDADFSDLFEIRGLRRARRGILLAPKLNRHSLTLAYRGLDGRTRRTAIAFSGRVEIHDKRITLPLDLGPRASWRVIMTISSDGDTTRPLPKHFLRELIRAKRQTRWRIRSLDRIETDNPKLNQWLKRAAADLALLITELNTGPYPYAGIPWFSVPFGRDAVVTALQLLWLEPEIARGVLTFLSRVQAAEESSFRDAQPGKIMHESRKGEMATLREVPFERYYGGVDTTPLFVLLAGAYFRRTNDTDFMREIWPAVHAALGWIDHFGDMDEDNLVEYLRAEETGLQNQGWKDSADSIFHADGTLAEGAIALVEVQAYVAAAKETAADIAEALGEPEIAARLTREAEQVRAVIEEKFWSDRIGTYALALDGAKRRCEVRSSNAGHVLYCGAASVPRARAVAEQLMSPAFNSGWGIRTLADGEARYNPISYHNGTVWPHDCSIVAAGMARYGMTAHAARIFTCLFEAACRLPAFRLPELFCGFRRRPMQGPVAYPSACTPQAWASGAPFLLLQSCLGIDIDAAAGEIDISAPCLPDGLNEIHIRDLTVGETRASVYVRRNRQGIETGISTADGEVSVVSLSGTA